MSDIGAQRHRARERALEILYEAHIKGRDESETLAQLAVAPDDFTQMLVQAAADHREETHVLIGQYSTDWPVERMAVIDRLVVELAVAELLTADSPPRAVILDEAVELAKTYSTDGSGGFVNGLLTSIADHVGR